MKRLIMAAVLMWVVVGQGKSWGAEYDSLTTLSGTVKSSKGEAPDGKFVQFPSLQLFTPITVSGKDEVTEKGVVLVQLVLQGDMMNKYKTLKGKKARVGCTLFHSDNGNHYTNVLCEAKTFDVLK